MKTYLVNFTRNGQRRDKGRLNFDLNRLGPHPYLFLHYQLQKNKLFYVQLVIGTLNLTAIASHPIY